jgi:hypothetical protein
MYPMLDDLRFISQVWSLEVREAVEFAQLNVFSPDLINNLLIGLTGGSAVPYGAIKPLPDSCRVNAFDLCDDFRMQPFKILMGREPDHLLFVLKAVEGITAPVVSRISYGVHNAKKQRILYDAI